MFSKACEYGIKATICLANRSEMESWVSLNDIALEIGSPVSFTAKILQKLVRNKVIISAKGPTGGFAINKTKAGSIRLCEVVSAIDGESVYLGCGLGFQNCNEKKPCALHYKFKNIRDDLKNMLEETSLFDLTADLNNGITFLKQQ